MRVLYLSYTGLAEPLGRTQVLPYLESLHAHGHTFTVLSFEKPWGPSALRRDEVTKLLPPGTLWIPLCYHKNPPLLSSAWDILAGAFRGALAPTCDVIHGRGTVAAAMAALVAALKQRPFVFDVRGLLAQEYVDAAHWRANALATLVTQRAEGWLLRRATGLVFLTSRLRADLRATGQAPTATPTVVIPCVADPARFCFSPDARWRVRSELGLHEEPLLVYSGSLGSWYLPAEMLEFFAVARDVLPGLRFLGLTPQPHLLEGEAARRGLAGLVLARTVSPERVPDYLSAADAGISFIAPTPSKRASSPTKLAEYLACGLPVVLNSGVGDVDVLAGEPSWLIVDHLEREAYLTTAHRLREALEDPVRREKARATADRHYSFSRAIESYDQLYRELNGATG